MMPVLLRKCTNEAEAIGYKSYWGDDLLSLELEIHPIAADGKVFEPDANREI